MSNRHWPGAERPREQLLELARYAILKAAVELAWRHFREALRSNRPRLIAFEESGTSQFGAGWRR
jgi:hypothetical protein